MSVAFHVRVEFPSLEASCGAGNAWANAVSGKEFRRLKSKKEKRGMKRIEARLDGNRPALQWH